MLGKLILTRKEEPSRSAGAQAKKRKKKKKRCVVKKGNFTTKKKEKGSWDGVSVFFRLKKKRYFHLKREGGNDKGLLKREI